MGLSGTRECVCVCVCVCVRVRARVLGGSPGCGQSLPGPAQTFQASEMLAWAQEQVTLPRSM